jgi:hypothetical protein
MLGGFDSCHHCEAPLGITTETPDAVVPVTDEPQKTHPQITVGGMYLFEVFCRIPLINVFLLAIVASSVHESPMREISRAKLLTMLTVVIFFLLLALTIVMLMHLDVIPPIYLGRWA